MKIRLNKLKINNFRGIQNSEISFSENTNFIVGNNGTGKTSCLAVIARLMPILRGEKRIFLDGDFLFNDFKTAKPIELTYYFDIISDKQTNRSIRLKVKSERAEKDGMKSHLNNQQTGMISTFFSEDSDIIFSINKSDREKLFTQRVIRNGWSGGRICPISLQVNQRQKHAATSKGEESGAFDGLRARLVQKLRGSELGKIVDREHPDLLNNVLNFTNKFLDDLRFIDIQIGYSDILSLVRSDNSIQAWDSLSGGEQSAFNLAMAIEFSRLDKSQFLIIEEPETTLHPDIQRIFINIIKQYFPNCQIFISTHSPYIFQNHLSVSNLVIGKKAKSDIFLQNPDSQKWLFSSVSWGELSFHAYNLATFEYHNELYGWIQEKSGNLYEKEIEKYFSKIHVIPQNKVWRRFNKNCKEPYKVTIMTYIRNYTHHPENPCNKMYSESELSNSIDIMLNIVENIRGYEV